MELYFCLATKIWKVCFGDKHWINLEPSVISNEIQCQ